LYYKYNKNERERSIIESMEQYSLSLVLGILLCIGAAAERVEWRKVQKSSPIKVCSRFLHCCYTINCGSLTYQFVYWLCDKWSVTVAESATCGIAYTVNYDYPHWCWYRG